MTTVILPAEKILSTREFGSYAREVLDLDALDAEISPIHIFISSTTYAISNSFFIGCFLDSIRALGRLGFEQKYKFVYVNLCLSNMVEDGINRCDKMNNYGGV